MRCPTSSTPALADQRARCAQATSLLLQFTRAYCSAYGALVCPPAAPVLNLCWCRCKDAIAQKQAEVVLAHHELDEVRLRLHAAKQEHEKAQNQAVCTLFCSAPAQEQASEWQVFCSCVCCLVCSL